MSEFKVGDRVYPKAFGTVQETAGAIREVTKDGRYWITWDDGFDLDQFPYADWELELTND